MIRIDLKTTIILSTALALTLNVFQFTHDALADKNSALLTYKDPIVSTNTKPASLASTTKTTSVATETIPVDDTTPTGSLAEAVVDPTAIAIDKLDKAGLNSEFASLYLAAADGTGAPWQLLAAVHKVETNQRGTTAVTSYAGAMGPMQFMPATFKAYSVDGDKNGVLEITDLEDAVYSAGHYLAVSGANRGQIRNALYSYNHSWAYVNKVQSIATQLGL